MGAVRLLEGLRDVGALLPRLEEVAQLNSGLGSVVPGERAEAVRGGGEPQGEEGHEAGHIVRRNARGAEPSTS